MGVLGEDVSVQMRHPMAHDQVVDLPRTVHGVDRSPRTLHIVPETAQLVCRQETHVRHVLPQDHEAVPRMGLVPGEPDLRRWRRDDKYAVLVLRKVRIPTHSTLDRIEQGRPLRLRPPHRMRVARVCSQRRGTTRRITI